MNTFAPTGQDDNSPAFGYESMRPQTNFLFADASVHFLPYTADPIMPALATRAGGEVVEVPN